MTRQRNQHKSSHHSSRDARDEIRRHRKRAQLITQIAQSVQLFMADVEDDDLCTLTYSHVELVGSGEHVRVMMCAPHASQEEPVDLEALQLKLDALAAEARMEVAHDIRRKRAPLISFLVIPGQHI